MRLRYADVLVLAVLGVALYAMPASAADAGSAAAASDLAQTLDVRVNANADDAEEVGNPPPAGVATGSVQKGDADLDLITDSDGSVKQVVGLRFNGIAIPPGASITSAYLQFTADESQSVATSLTVTGQASDNPSTFSTNLFDLSNRPATSASVPWTPDPWLAAGDAGFAQRTPDLASIVQEIVNRPGWSSGNSLVVFLRGSGRRTAVTYNQSASKAALLHVEWGGAGAPSVMIGSPRSPTTANQGDAVTFSGGALDPEDGDLTAGLTWTSNLDGTIGTGGTFTTSGLSVGVHAITATATDSSGATGSATVIATVFAPTNQLLAAGDIAGCASDGDTQTSALLDDLSGVVLILGDNAYPDGSSQDYAGCYDPTWGRHKARTRPVPGNHEYHTAGAAGYFGYFGPAAGDAAQGYYSYDVDGWHIVALNSEIDHSAGSSQLAWLQADLSVHAADCTLAYWHRPRFSSGTVHGSAVDLDPFWQVLYQHGADVVLNGHEHNYERFAPQNPAGVADQGGIREFVVGTGGKSLYNDFAAPLATSEARNTAAYGVLRLTLDPTSYTWQFVPVAGQTYTDSGTASCVTASSNRGPSANAGPDQTITLPATANLNGTVSDDGLPDPPGTVTTMWGVISGPDTVSFGDASAVDTTASFSAAGTYVLQLAASDGALSSSDTLTVTVNPPSGGNQAPVVAAGPDQTVTLPASASLDGTVTDDGLPNPPASVTTIWSKTSGPGTVAFGDAASVDTTASFSQVGTYVLRLTADDGVFQSFDELTITVNSASGGDLVFADGFESGSFSAWSAALTGGGDLSVSPTAALAGTYGMRALINDNTSIFLSDSSPSTESRYRARFYFDPNSIAMAKNNAHFIFDGRNASHTRVLRVEFRWSGTQYQVRTALLADTTSFTNTPWFAITDAPHSIELDWDASTTPGANNGSLTFFVDGVQKAALVAVDNDTRRVDEVRLGAVAGLDTGTRGAYFFDGFESRRLSYIGP